jgi:endogenous inhibitor of DNA gyrase (YacG/DUF329 family)
MLCPICKKEANTKYKPFCSDRCEQIDLHAWFSGSYALPMNENQEISEEDLLELEELLNEELTLQKN